MAEDKYRAEGERIARALGQGVRYDGPWLFENEFIGYGFTDREVTGTSFICKDIESCKAKLILKREQFHEKPPSFQVTDFSTQTVPSGSKTYREIMHDIISKYSRSSPEAVEYMFAYNERHNQEERLRHAIYLAKKHGLPEANLLEGFAKKRFPRLLEKMREEAAEPKEEEEEEEEEAESPSFQVTATERSTIMKVIHYSEDSPFFLKPIVIKNKTPLSRNKPWGGLWASPADSKEGWESFCKAEALEFLQAAKSKVTMDIEMSRFITIDSVADLNRLPWKGDTYGEGIDFEALAKMGVQGIYLTAKGKGRTRLSFPRNLYEWDCETVLILDEKAIRHYDVTSLDSILALNIKENAALRTDPALDAAVKHLGYESVSLSRDEMARLPRNLPTDRELIDQSQQRLGQTREVPERELTPAQKAHLKLAAALARSLFTDAPAVRAAEIPPASDRVQTAGMYGTSTGTIYIAVPQLSRGRDAVHTLVHELGHHRVFTESGQAEDLVPGHAKAMKEIAAHVIELVDRGKIDGSLKEVLW